MIQDDIFVDPSALVDADAEIGAGTKVWNWTKVRERARIGRNCIIGQGVYIDYEVTCGDGCKVQNGAQLYHGVSLGNGVFVGPNVTFTNDKYPRAHNADWKVVKTVIEDGASIGAGAVIVCGVRLGKHCMVGAGALVVEDVPAHGLVVGGPARLVDYVTVDGRRLNHDMAGPPPPPTQLRGDSSLGV